MSKAKTSLILRVTVPLGALGGPADRPAEEKSQEAFRQYIAQACAAEGVLRGLVIAPDPAPPAVLNAAQHAAFREFYLTAYQQARKHDKNILMLGTGSARQRRNSS